MPNLFVSYDLINQKNYPAVEKAIKECGTAVRVLLSVWYIKSDDTHIAVRDHIQKAMDKDDRLLVINAGDAAWINVLPGASEDILSNWSK
ncbi:hypothetical protein TSA6c_17240 [Azospirillum sp. TSA6c]|uniref:hypothetical protein n=1 Tax=Azospirillum sp. TSA6c TaxID=709813 RepID=UPI000D618786|nr:hypothetical protein [Azospirillum sp. TSA6c]PWC48170.1 hypothetical protein TSA6c_17240 [Azospirillum sp. TSA6c]